MARPSQQSLDVAKLNPRQLQELMAQAQEALDRSKSERIEKLRLRWEREAEEEGLTMRQVAYAGLSGSGKVAPKYRDPKTGKTWSGRGKKPLWLEGHEAAYSLA